MVQRTHTQRTDHQPPQPLGVETALHLDRYRQTGPITDREQHTHRLLAQPSQGDLQDTSRSGVQPLHVIDGHQHRRSLGQDAHHIEHGQPNRMHIRRCDLTRLDEQQRHLQGTAPRSHQQRHHVIEHRRQQLRQTGKRQRCLSLHPATRQRPPVAVARRVDRCSPQTRLADPSLASQDQRRRAPPETRDELVDHSKLDVTPNDTVGMYAVHPHPILVPHPPGKRSFSLTGVESGTKHVGHARPRRADPALRHS